MGQSLTGKLPSHNLLQTTAPCSSDAMQTQTTMCRRRAATTALSAAAAVCCLQALAGIPTASAGSSAGSDGKARRTLYYQDSSCSSETFQEFAYDSTSIDSDGLTTRGTGTLARGFRASLDVSVAFSRPPVAEVCLYVPREALVSLPLFFPSGNILAVDDFFPWGAHTFTGNRTTRRAMQLGAYRYSTSVGIRTPVRGWAPDPRLFLFTRGCVRGSSLPARVPRQQA